MLKNYLHSFLFMWGRLSRVARGAPAPPWPCPNQTNKFSCKLRFAQWRLWRAAPHENTMTIFVRMERTCCKKYTASGSMFTRPLNACEGQRLLPPLHRATTPAKCFFDLTITNPSLLIVAKFKDAQTGY